MMRTYESENYCTPRAISGAMSGHILNLKEKILSYGAGSALEVAPGACDLAEALAGEFERYVTVDPSAQSARLLAGKKVRHFRGRVEDFRDDEGFSCIIARHLIEHIGAPKKFLESMVGLLKEGGVLYLETPNAREIFHSLRFYELRYEHCGYYDPATLSNALAKLHCELVEECYFHQEQWVGLFFQKRSGSASEKRSFPLYEADLKDAVSRLEQALEPFKAVALYGAAGHANSLLSYLSQESVSKICCAIDKDTRRQGKYLLNSNIAIKSNEAKNLAGMDCVLMAMPCYEDLVFESELKNFKGAVLFTRNLSKKERK